MGAAARLVYCPPAGVAKLADARDSKSREGHPSCGFDPHLRHYPLLESEGRRQLAMSLGLRHQVGGYLLRGGHGVGSGDESPRRWVLARDGEKRLRQLGRVSGLLTVLALPELVLLRPALVVIGDGRRG